MRQEGNDAYDHRPGTIDPELAAALSQVPMGPDGVVFDLRDIDATREAVRAFAAAIAEATPDDPSVSVDARHVRRADGTELEVRVLRPDRRGPLPAVLWFHGGGQVLGFAAQDDLYLKPLCANVGCVVVSVDYRPAPDYPSPAGAQDGVDAYTWVRKSADAVGVDADRIAEPFC